MKVLVFVGIFSVAFGMPGKFRDPMINKGLFQGDIILNHFQILNAVPLNFLRWPHGVVPYVIEAELNREIPLILSAMKHIEAHTCIRFVERTNEKDFVWIHFGTGCKSWWGRKGGGQELSLGPGCYHFGIIVHELIHAIGFQHEHSRSDRDDYVTINWDNIDMGDWADFKKYDVSESRLFLQFDVNSIMLYGSRAFAINPFSYSMVFKDGSIIEEVKNKNSMTNLDAAKINTLYQCP